MRTTHSSLKGRSFLAEIDFTEEELLYLLDLAANLKEKKKNGIPHRYLEGKNIALLFEKNFYSYTVCLYSSLYRFRRASRVFGER